MPNVPQHPARPEPPRAPAGFTLIELLTVLAIIAILSGIAIGVGRRAGESGKIARAKVEVAALSAALESYKRQYGDYPQTNEPDVFLQSLIGKKGPLGADIAGRVLLGLVHFTTDGGLDPFSNSSAELVDPWGQTYRYVYNKSDTSWINPGFVLYSIGPDGVDSPSLITGGFPDVARQENTDNIYANRN